MRGVWGGGGAVAGGWVGGRAGEGGREGGGGEGGWRGADGLAGVGRGRAKRGGGGGVPCCGRRAQPGSAGRLGRGVPLGGAVCVGGSGGGRIPPGSLSRPWGVGADSKFKLPLGSSAMTLCRGVCRLGGGEAGGRAADNGSSWEETRVRGAGRGGRSLPRWHQLHFLIASSPSPASRRVRLNGAGEPAERQRLLRALKMSGSLARCVAPGNNAMRSPAASEQHDDEGQAASLHHLPPR